MKSFYLNEISAPLFFYKNLPISIAMYVIIIYDEIIIIELKR
jgi:hypothetical protein